MTDHFKEANLHPDFQAAAETAQMLGAYSRIKKTLDTRGEKAAKDWDMVEVTRPTINSRIVTRRWVKSSAIIKIETLLNNRKFETVKKQVEVLSKPLEFLIWELLQGKQATSVELKALFNEDANRIKQALNLLHKAGLSSVTKRPRPAMNLHTALSFDFSLCRAAIKALKKD